MANPLIGLELTRRFRSPAAAWGIPLMVLLPGIAVVVVYATTIATGDRFSSVPLITDSNDPMVIQRGTGVLPSELQDVGLGMFVAVAGALALTLLVMVPAMVGGSIAGERHNQTLQPLQLTAMTPTQIVFGKLVSSLAYLGVALTCAAPVLVIPFLLGGISVGQVVGAYAVLMLVTFEYAAISLAVSSVVSRPAPAIVVALLVCGALTLAPWIAAGVGYLTASANDPSFDTADSALRYLVGPSPVSLGSWVVDATRGRSPDLVAPGDKVGSMLWFLLISVGSLQVARSRVVAPADRDR